MSKKAKIVYAIDFGTSNSLLGAASRDEALPLLGLDADAPDATVLRSILFFPNRDEVYFGQRAIREFVQRDMEGRLIRSIKKYLPMRSFVGTYVEDRPLNLEDIIAIFLREMRSRANERLGADVRSVVLGRPAKFSAEPEEDAFAQYRLERAAREAGFTEIEFFPEPIAAAFGFRSTLTGPQTILVVDLGGGTSDFTVIRVDKGNYKASNVLGLGGVSVAGDLLDGDLMRHRVVRHFGAEVRYQVPFGTNTLTMPKHLMEKLCSPADISMLRKRDTMEFLKNVKTWSLGGEDRRKMDQLFCLLDNQLGFPVFEEIEQAKRRLTDADQTRFQFKYPGIEVEETITREQFESYTQEHINQIFASLEDTMRQAGLDSSQIDQVCCTGGTVRVPAIRNGLVLRFGAEKIRIHNTYHCVVEGLRERAREIASAS